jgi:hypothetical protein
MALGRKLANSHRKTGGKTGFLPSKHVAAADVDRNYQWLSHQGI